ncbi:MAG: PilZ domain-containing protein [Methylocella sp.]
MSAPEHRTTETPAHESRNEARRRALKEARIAFKGHGAVIDCVVCNLSDRGACLKVASPIGIPDTFDLLCDFPSSVRNCRVTWRKATQIGVEFV